MKKEDEYQLSPDSSSFFVEENRLLEKIRLGNLPEANKKEKEEAEESAIALASLYYPYAEKVARKEFYYCDESTINDLAQEGWFALIVCAKRFDPSRGVKFSTFAFPYIKKACQNFLKSNDLTSSAIEDSPDFVEENEGDEDSSVFPLSEAVSALTPRQKEAIGYRFGLFGKEQRKTYAQIGEAMGVSGEAARVLVITGLGKMKRKIGEEGE